MFSVFLPSDVHKQVLSGLVDVEHFIPEQAEAGGALQSHLPQRQRCGVAVQDRMAQDEANWGENGEKYNQKSNRRQQHGQNTR